MFKVTCTHNRTTMGPWFFADFKDAKAYIQNSILKMPEYKTQTALKVETDELEFQKHLAAFNRKHPEKAITIVQQISHHF